MYRIFLFSFSLILIYSSKSFAGVGDLAKKGKEAIAQKGKKTFVQYAKNGTRSVLNHIPGGKFLSDLIFDDGESMEERVERIDKNQKSSLSKVREISDRVLESKRKVEDLWYHKTWTIDQASSLAARLKQSKPKNMLGSAIEDFLQIPLNPAEYIPNIPGARALKESLDYDLSFERGTNKDINSLLSNTRASLLATGIANMDKKTFKDRYQNAREYDETLLKALQAKDIARVKGYKADVERLTKEIKVLEEQLTQQGLTVGDVMQITMAIDIKRQHIRELNEKIDQALKEAANITQEQQMEIDFFSFNEFVDGLDKYMEEEEKRMRYRNR